MLFAMDNATQNYINKGIIQSNSKLSQMSSIDFASNKSNIFSASTQNIRLRRNKSQIDMNDIQNKKR